MLIYNRKEIYMQMSDIAEKNITDLKKDVNLQEKKDT